MCILSPTTDRRSSILPSNIPPNARWVFWGLRTKHSDDAFSTTIEQGMTNLPVVHDSFILEKAKRGLGDAVGTMSDAHVCFGFFRGDWQSILIHFYPIRPNFLSLFPLRWWFREWEFDIPSEGALIVALEAEHQHVLGPGTHAWEIVWGWDSAQSCHLLLNPNSRLLGTALFRFVSLTS